MAEDERGGSRISGRRREVRVGGRRRQGSVRRREVGIRSWRREDKRYRIVEEEERDW